MSTLKHKILEHLVKHGELNIEPADVKFGKVDKEDLDQAAQELDQAGHGVYTRTMDRLFLNSNANSKKAFEDGVYLDKPIDPAGAPPVEGVSVDGAPKVVGAKLPVKVAKAAGKPSAKRKS